LGPALQQNGSHFLVRVKDNLKVRRLRRIPAPIPDMGVPASEEVMATIMNVVRGSITTGSAVYVHCWGGIGRTGTVVGCWLRECGLGPDEALARVQHLYATHMPKSKDVRYQESPQTREQKVYIRSWNKNW
jgi:protein-tyrosine phosphatase